MFNPAFDVTPYAYLSAIVRERGVAPEPFGPEPRLFVEANDG